MNTIFYKQASECEGTDQDQDHNLSVDVVLLYFTFVAGCRYLLFIHSFICAVIRKSSIEDVTSRNVLNIVICATADTPKSEKITFKVLQSSVKKLKEPKAM